MKCMECAFWVPLDKQEGMHDDDKAGSCRRFPPVLDPVFLEQEASRYGGSESMASYWEFPVTRSYAWCGEFKEVTA